MSEENDSLDECAVPGADDDPIDVCFDETLNGDVVDTILAGPDQNAPPPPPADTTAVGGRQALEDPDELYQFILEELENVDQAAKVFVDGAILAAEQVQDKRLDWLEAGPEVSLGEIMFSACLVFMLESPMLIPLFQGAFAGIGRGLVKFKVRGRKAALARINQRVSKTWNKIRPLEVGLLGHRKGISQKRALIDGLGRKLNLSATSGQRMNFRRQQAEYLSQIARHQNAISQLKKKRGVLLAQHGRLQTKRTQKAKKPLTTQQFAQFLKKLKGEYGVAGLKAARVINAPTDIKGSGKTGSDTIAVQLISLAQGYYSTVRFMLRDIRTQASAAFYRSMHGDDDLQRYLYRTAAHAELRDLADQIAAKDSASTAAETAGARDVIALNLELIIWAHLFESHAGIEAQDIDPYSLESFAQLWDMIFKNLPERVVVYLQTRFFQSHKGSPSALFPDTAGQVAVGEIHTALARIRRKFVAAKQQLASEQPEEGFLLLSDLKFSS